MLIAMSSKRAVRSKMKHWAKQYNEEAIFYTAMEQRGFSLKPHDRLSFVGLAKPMEFGDLKLTPEKFAGFLIGHGLAKDKPVIVDLLGCFLGDLINW